MVIAPLSEEVREWQLAVFRLLGLTVSEPDQAEIRQEGGGDTATASWMAVKATFVARLNAELAWIRSVPAKPDDPDFASLRDLKSRSELELHAVRANVNGEVANGRQALEMERYLGEDDIVAAVCEYTGFDIGPLIAALQPIKAPPA